MLLDRKCDALNNVLEVVLHTISPRHLRVQVSSQECYLGGVFEFKHSTSPIRPMPAMSWAIAWGNDAMACCSRGMYPGSPSEIGASFTLLFTLLF
ncbi:hypothetical protein TNCT_690971 [Trichonephila clavata]|uniref:Uncharacterized protein n=1 Tax=Trichonephila clavata TaxID=2740835 RepID=A0A8X6FF28_TRICU|nr:hypothetical protein TNCT_690971 [Trichonephila clavata]